MLAVVAMRLMMSLMLIIAVLDRPKSRMPFTWLE